MFKSALRSPKTAAPAPVVALRDVRKVYGRGEGAVAALDGVSVALAAGSFTALMGPSGSGKSTFLNVAAGLDRPTSGTVGLGDTELAGLSERRLTVLRRERIGFVFQAFNLLPSLTVAQKHRAAAAVGWSPPYRCQPGTRYTPGRSRRSACESRTRSWR
jgi:putative ABC transport system ATP-binding protein